MELTPSEVATSSPIISVRSEVERTVDPDSVSLHGLLSISRGNKAAALQAASVGIESLKSGLDELGGVALSAATARSPLTWSTQRVTTYPDQDPSKRMSSSTVATASVLITVRDLHLLEPLEQFLTAMENFEMSNAVWHVDNDNTAWAELRAEAIQEALRKGSDYAAALGATLTGVQHIADVGLLGGDDGGSRSQRVFAAAARSEGGPGGSPSLDPAPQVLVARIEARFHSTPIPLDVSHP